MSVQKRRPRRFCLRMTHLVPRKFLQRVPCLSTMVSSHHHFLCTLAKFSVGTVNANNSFDVPGCKNWWNSTNWADPEVLEAIAHLNAPDAAPSAESHSSPHLPDLTTPSPSKCSDDFTALPSISTTVLNQPASLHAPDPEMVATELVNVQPPVSHTTAVASSISTPVSHQPASFHAPVPETELVNVQPPVSCTTVAAPLAIHATLDKARLDPIASSPLPASTSVAGVAPFTVEPQSQVPRSENVTSATRPLPVHGPTPLRADVTALTMDPYHPLPLTQSSHISTPFLLVPRYPPVSPGQSGIGKRKRGEPSKENIAPSSNKSPSNGTPAGPNGARPTRAPLQDLPSNGALAGCPNELRPTPLPPPDVPSNSTPAEGANGLMPTPTLQYIPTNALPPTPTPPPIVAPPLAMDDTIRRSSRVPVPSTRLDRQNEIGTNIIPPNPPVDVGSVIEEPSWFAPAYNHLKNNALGPMWANLVEKWAEYERAKGWKSGRVCLLFLSSALAN